MLDRTRIAFSGFWWENLDSDEKVAVVCGGLAGLGYRGVEWKETCFPADMGCHAALEMAARATRAAGLAVTNFVILRNLGDPQGGAKAAEEVCEFIRASSSAGVKIVNMVPGPVACKSVPPEDWWKPAGPDWAASWDTFLGAFERVLQVAEAEGVVVAIEAMAGSLVHDYYSTLELFRRLESPSLALTFDPSHYLIHDSDIGWSIRQLGPKIRHVHLKDAVGRVGAFGRDMLFPILGEGAIDWHDFFSALDDAGYDGWMAIEFESFKYMYEVLRGDAMEAARLSMRSYKALAGAGG